jgi:hypothetical protein
VVHEGVAAAGASHPDHGLAYVLAGKLVLQGLTRYSSVSSFTLYHTLYYHDGTLTAE